MELIYLLDQTAVCNVLKPVMTALGYVIFGIKVIVPIILIVVGMMDLTKAIMGKDDSEIKKAQSSLIKKVIVAVLVYLVITLVGLIMGLVGRDQTWQTCAECAFNPFENGCGIVNDSIDTSTNGTVTE